MRQGAKRDTSRQQASRREIAAVADRWEADRAAMLTIPPVGPPDWWPLRTRLGRDHYIRLDTNGYSVRPRAIGHIVTVRCDTEEITVTCGDDPVARHARCWARHQSIADPEHTAAARQLREEVWQQQAARTPPKPHSSLRTASVSRSNSASWAPTTACSRSSRAEAERRRPDGPHHRPDRPEDHHGRPLGGWPGSPHRLYRPPPTWPSSLAP